MNQHEIDTIAATVRQRLLQDLRTDTTLQRALREAVGLVTCPMCKTRAAGTNGLCTLCTLEAQSLIYAAQNSTQES